MSDKKTPSQVLAGYIKRLDDRQDYLHEKININNARGKPTGYELEEWFAIRWVMAFILDNPTQALEHLTQDLATRSERKQ